MRAQGCDGAVQAVAQQVDVAVNPRQQHPALQGGNRHYGQSLGIGVGGEVTARSMPSMRKRTRYADS